MSDGQSLLTMLYPKLLVQPGYSSHISPALWTKERVPISVLESYNLETIICMPVLFDNIYSFMQSRVNEEYHSAGKQGAHPGATFFVLLGAIGA